MINDRGQSEVTVNKVELLETIKKNRQTHEAEFKEATQGYRSESVKVLTQMLKDAKAEKEFKSYTGLEQPPCHLQEYDRVIKMLEMSVYEIIKLSETQFNNFVMDNWNWSNQFKTVNASYLSKTR
jgi:hypothetical protein